MNEQLFPHIMKNNGWIRELHSFPNFKTKEYRYHKNGFELPEKQLVDLIEYLENCSYG